MKEETCGRCGGQTMEPAMSMCGHVFCTPCLQTIFATSKKCPLCNKRNPPVSTGFVESIPFNQGIYFMLEARKGNSEDNYTRAISFFERAISDKPT